MLQNSQTKAHTNRVKPKTIKGQCKTATVTIIRFRSNVVNLDNGLKYQSNIKHTRKGIGARPGIVASIEPRNSLDLFKKSVPTSNPKSDLRFYFDGEVVHQFALSNGVYHWAGIKGKQQANQIPMDIKHHFNINVKKLKDVSNN